MIMIMRKLAIAVFWLGGVAGWISTRCYRLSGRLNGYSFEIQRRVGG